MSVPTLLARGRVAAERLMVDSCVIRRRTGKFTDPDTGRVTYVYDDVYTGRCRVQTSGAGAQARADDTAEARQLLLRLEVQLPVAGSEGIRTSDEVEVTACVHDADLVSRTFVVHDLAHKSHATSRRIQVEEIT